MENNEYIDVLIAKLLTGEATGEELVELTEWENLSEENRLYVAQSRKLFGHVANIEVDANAAWNKLKQRIDAEADQEDETPVVEMKPVRSLRNNYLLVAASIAVILTLTLFLTFFNGEGNTIQQNYAATDAVLEANLPDGSKVLLNSHSTLAYEEKGKGPRALKLKGEAYFTVKHNEEKPFVIQVDEVLVRDVGTAFNVKELPNAAGVEVYVEEGIVDLYTETNKGIRLVKGETGIYNKATKTFTKSIDDRYIKGAAMPYKSKVFNFNSTPLSEVVAQLNAVYGNKFELADDAIKNCPITVDFANETPDNIIAVITETLGLKATKQGEKTILSGQGCN